MDERIYELERKLMLAKHRLREAKIVIDVAQSTAEGAFTKRFYRKFLDHLEETLRELTEEGENE